MPKIRLGVKFCTNITSVTQKDIIRPISRNPRLSITGTSNCPTPIVACATNAERQASAITVKIIAIVASHLDVRRVQFCTAVLSINSVILAVRSRQITSPPKKTIINIKNKVKPAWTTKKA